MTVLVPAQAIPRLQGHPAGAVSGNSKKPVVPVSLPGGGAVVLAIDPGTTESAYALLDTACRPLACDKVPNDEMLSLLRRGAFPPVRCFAIEMVASYGMPVGAEVFETCVWIGRLAEAAGRDDTRLVKRAEVKLHHCRSSRARDSNVTQALIDRFAPGAANKGKGTKNDPGFFHGFKRDMWQAFALAVYVRDRETGDC